MHPCSIKLLVLSIVLSVTTLFSASDVSEISSQSDLPNLIVKTIYNNTPYDLLLVDRLVKNSGIILPAGKNTEVNLKPNEQDEVMLKYKEPFIVVKNMAKKAQYVFKKLDQDGKLERGKKLYFDLHMIRTSKSFSLKCYVANTKGYCGRFTHTFNGYFRQIVEFELEVSINTKSVSLDSFELHIDPKFSCKRYSINIERGLLTL
jgi:hypothetical protein